MHKRTGRDDKKGKANERPRRTLAQVTAARKAWDPNSGKAKPDFKEWEVCQISRGQMDRMAAETGGPVADSRCKIQPLSEPEQPLRVTGWRNSNGGWIDERGRSVAQATPYLGSF
ncbi:MAG: hypothetical protein Q8Q32_03085 [bacterium]|nr:hypothetical protein [bacterium]